MERNLSSLQSREFDLLVVGGGVFGAALVWQAALRGLRSALLEKGDFGQGTSSQCFKIVHGGFRYLQHLDLLRIRESSRERNFLLRSAPHLVRPLPILVPTRGWGGRGWPLLLGALGLYNLLTWDRNRALGDPARRVPSGGFLGGARLKGRPWIPPWADGAVWFADAQMYSPSRLVLAFLKSAWREGAQLANYLEVTRFVQRRGRVVGVEAFDRLGGGLLQVRARLVVCAAGPWTGTRLGFPATPPLSFHRDLCLVLRRPPSLSWGLGLPCRDRDADALLSRGGRHLFLVPWRGRTLAGVWHRPHQGPPEEVQVEVEEVLACLEQLNRACPDLKADLEDVALVQAGLVPSRPGSRSDLLRFGRRSLILDHGSLGGPQGLISVLGVRFTVAAAVARRVLRQVAARLGRGERRPREGALYGGDFRTWQELVDSARSRLPLSLPAEGLLRRHGSAWEEVLRGSSPPSLLVPEQDVLVEEILYAVRREMAVHLSDVVFRRVELGTGGHPGWEALSRCAAVMGAELGWSEKRLQQELEQVQALFPSWARPARPRAEALKLSS